MKKVKRTIPKTSREAVIALDASMEFAHQSSAAIAGRMRVLYLDLEETDRSIVALQAETKRQNDRKRTLAAKIAGMSSVIGMR